MKKTLSTFVLSILFLITFSCNNDDDSSDSNTSISGTWELIRFEDRDSGMIHMPLKIRPTLSQLLLKPILSRGIRK